MILDVDWSIDQRCPPCRPEPVDDRSRELQNVRRLIRARAAAIQREMETNPLAEYMRSEYMARISELDQLSAALLAGEHRT